MKAWIWDIRTSREYKGVKQCYDQRIGTPLTRAVGTKPRKVGRDEFLNVLVWHAK